MNQENVPTWEELIGDNILIEYNLQFDVNFSSGKTNETQLMFLKKIDILIFFLQILFEEIFDAIMEGQQFEDFCMDINVVIRQAILRKVSYIVSARSHLSKMIFLFLSNRICFMKMLNMLHN